MNEAGFYDGDQDFYLVIPKKDPESFKLHFQGNQYLAQKYMLRQYLEDTFAMELEGLQPESRLKSKKKLERMI
jgi:hypothetical protein